MDNIREKLAELLETARLKYHVYKEEFSHKCDSVEWHDYWADHLIANNVTVQEWIPVSERLPEEGKDVLAFCYWHESWEVQVCHLSSNWSGQWYTSIAGQWVVVSHWQYLPQPPKGE